MDEQSTPENRATEPVPFLELIEEAQRSNDWTDEELERRMGLREAGPMSLVRQGAVHLSYSTALKIDEHLNANALVLLKAAIHSHAAAIEDAVLAMYGRLSLDADNASIVAAYRAVLAGDMRVTTLTLPQATVWVVPHAILKPESGSASSN